jgi:RNA polymerase sigma factor (sigma-70 family)
MSEIDPIPPALKALYDDERVAPVGGAEERAQIRLRVLAMVGVSARMGRAAVVAPMATASPGKKLGRWKDEQQEALLALWRTGDATAGQELFRRSYKSVSRYFMNKVDGEVHDDLVQQTFLACLGSSTPFRGDSSFRTYLLGVAHQILIDHFRRSPRAAGFNASREVDVERLIAADAFAEPLEAIARQQEHRILLAALRRLPFQLQVVLELHYWESLTAREIAEVLGVPPATVKTRLRDGRVRLRDQLTSGSLAPDLRQSTMETLEGWAERVRGRMRVRDAG